MNKTTIDLLTNLKDIVLPDEPSFWPPSIIFIALILLSIVCFILLIHYFFYRLRVVNYKQKLLKEINNLQLDSSTFLDELNLILKRVALLTQDRDNLTQLSNEDWIQFLSTSIPKRISNSNKSTFQYLCMHLETIYESKDTDLDPERCLQAATYWISIQSIKLKKKHKESV